MPKGQYERKKVEPVKEAPIVERKEEAKAPVLKEEPKPQVAETPKLPTLAPGQRYFETPEGDIIVGEDGKDRIWSRRMNGGKGGWANPKR